LGDLFWWLSFGSIIVLTGIAALIAFAIRAQKSSDQSRDAHFIAVAGMVTHAIGLAAILIFGFGLLQ
jgi:hypothetical protein